MGGGVDAPLQGRYGIIQLPVERIAMSWLEDASVHWSRRTVDSLVRSGIAALTQQPNKRFGLTVGHAGGSELRIGAIKVHRFRLYHSRALTLSKL